MTTKQELQSQIDDMWSDMRVNDEMVVDAPEYRVGMPFVAPYEGVCFHVESEGHLVLVSIPVDRITRFAAALTALVPDSIAMDARCDAEIAAHDAISKAKGE